MNKFKTLVKENKEIVTILSVFTIITLTIATAVVVAIVSGDVEDDSVVITNHLDGSFTVSKAPSN
jgi:hypothetical protein